MADDEEMPEIATNEDWRGIMVRARKAHGLTQEQLGEKVGLSQVMISKIESGEASSSTYVLRIVRALSIPEPQHFANEEQRYWWELGHVLRTHPERYQAALRVAELLAQQVKEEQKAEAPPLEPPDKRK